MHFVPVTPLRSFPAAIACSRGRVCRFEGNTFTLPAVMRDLKIHFQHDYANKYYRSNNQQNPCFSQIAHKAACTIEKMSYYIVWQALT
jgi:hypothetical protein